MSDYFDDDENDETGNESRLVKDLRKQLKELSKERDTYKTRASELEGSVRKRTLEEVLTSKGVNAKVAAFIPSDVEGDEAVSKWLDEYADVFGVKVEPVQDTTPAGMSPEDVAALKRSQALSSGGVTPDKEAEMAAAIRNANTREELDAVVRQFSGK